LRDQIAPLAAEIAALSPELIVPAGPLAALAAHAAAPNTPLVFINVADSIALGLVHSLAHPGGHATGVATIVPEGFAGKTFQLIKEFVPTASRIGKLSIRQTLSNLRSQNTNAGVERAVGVKLVTVEATLPEQFAPAFGTASEQGAEAIVVAGDPATLVNSAMIVSLAARYRLPAIYFFRQSVLDGGLLSFEPDQAKRYRRAGAYVDKILKGESPADLLVEQPTHYEMLVNRKTAATLGLTIPPSMLAQTDEVIE
jgi:putative ABC transport system substrate-binding protein